MKIAYRTLPDDARVVILPWPPRAQYLIDRFADVLCELARMQETARKLADGLRGARAGNKLARGLAADQRGETPLDLPDLRRRR